MKDSLTAIVAALGAVVATSSIAWWKRIVSAVVAAAIALAISLYMPGCMSTTNLNGKSYSWRFDVLTPIGQTVELQHATDPNAHQDNTK